MYAQSRFQKPLIVAAIELKQVRTRMRKTETCMQIRMVGHASNNQIAQVCYIVAPALRSFHRI